MNKQQLITDLMNDYGTKVLHLAYTYVRNHQTAEDLAQEIFIKCFQHLDHFNGNSSLQTWVYRIAVNHCKDYLKSWHYRKVVVAESISSFLKSSQSSPEDQLIAGQARDDLIKQIYKLPVKNREIIFLYYFQECTQKEVSEILGVNVNTVKSRLSRSKELLKNSLLEGGGNDGEEVKSTKAKDA